MKIRPVGVQFFQADGWRDMSKLTFAFRNFANAPKHEPFQTTAVQHRHVDAVGCRTFFSGLISMLVFDILRIPCTPPPPPPPPPPPI